MQAELRIAALEREVQRRRETLTAYQETALGNTDEMLRQAEAQYREGRTQVLELVDAYTSVRDARLRTLSLANDARTAEINLARAVGTAGGLNGAAAAR